MKFLPHLPRLVDDYLNDFGKVSGFFNGDFRDLSSFRRQTESVQARRLPREALAAVLSEQNRTYGCGPETLDRIGKLAQERTGAVVTGQQVGLFSGPLYTIYKAFTAIKLAERLDRSGLGSFVPVFWLASDDHDLIEVDHLILLDSNNRLEDIRCPHPSDELKIPVAKIDLPPEISDGLRRLAELTPDSEFKTEILADLSEAYRPGRSWVEAFARWMTRLFKSYGLIFIDASDPRLKKLGSDVFVREIEGDSAATPPALAASQKLREAGYEAQIQMHEGILHVFYGEHGRRTIHRAEGAFELRDPMQTFRKEELLARTKEKPFFFSPNVLLRPIYQDALLPTVANIGGPGEIAYFAQMKGVYERFGLPMPVIYPRTTATIVERKIDHILKKYDLKIPDFWGDVEEIIRDHAQKQIPDSLDKALSLALAHIESDMASLIREVTAFEPTLKESAELAKGNMNRQGKFLEKKILQAAVKRNEIAVQQLRKAADNLYPRRHLQERMFNVVPYLLKYGYAFMEKLDRSLDIEGSDHRIITM
jgi:bacillithiol biosynthesis cysteine-adding enzyme BshC